MIKEGFESKRTYTKKDVPKLRLSLWSDIRRYPNEVYGNFIQGQLSVYGIISIKETMKEWCSLLMGSSRPHGSMSTFTPVLSSEGPPEAILRLGHVWKVKTLIFSLNRDCSVLYPVELLEFCCCTYLWGSSLKLFFNVTRNWTFIIEWVCKPRRDRTPIHWFHDPCPLLPCLKRVCNTGRRDSFLSFFFV